MLFLTTNRETVTDDAIRSRCMAHIRYVIPDNYKDRYTLWEILSKQYGVVLDKGRINQLVKAFPNATGRDIKQLCRLAKAMGDGKKPELELFQWLSQFQDMKE